MQEETTILSHGCKLQATVYSGNDSKAHKRPVIIIVPGGNGRHWVRENKPSYIGYDKLAEELARVGLSVLTFDGRGQGKSEGIRSMDHMADDLDAVLRALVTGQVPMSSSMDASRVGVMGVCLGGSVAFRCLAGDDRVSSIIGYGTTPSWKRCVYKTPEIIERWKKKKDLVGARVDFAAELALVDQMVYDVDRTLPMLTQHVLVANGSDDRDESFDYDFRNYINEMVKIVASMDKAQSAVFSILRKGSHVVDFGEDAWGAYVNLVRGWFYATLQTGRWKSACNVQGSASQ